MQLVAARAASWTSVSKLSRSQAMGFVRQIAAGEGLVSYGPSISWMYRQAGDYLGQIPKRLKSGGTACLAADTIRVGG
jgi:hypothetical protein